MHQALPSRCGIRAEVVRADVPRLAMPYGRVAVTALFGQPAELAVRPGRLEGAAALLGCCESTLVRQHGLLVMSRAAIAVAECVMRHGDVEWQLQLAEELERLSQMRDGVMEPALLRCEISGRAELGQGRRQIARHNSVNAAAVRKVLSNA